MSEYKASVDVFGDKIEVEWDGNVWIAPTCGAQFASRRDAMETELIQYFRAAGEDEAGVSYAVPIYLDAMEAADEPDEECNCNCGCDETATGDADGVACCDECSEYTVDVDGSPVCSRADNYGDVVASGGLRAAEKKEQEQWAADEETAARELEIAAEQRELEIAAEQRELEIANSHAI